ncbi:glycosyltransferase [Pelagibacteraceae bacterium]|nr:glycosyltransferase [Pelagibacteraceae bacterium]
MLTVVIPSFHSSKLIIERINEIKSEIPIIIIDNSKNYEFKKEIENKFSNVKIIIPNENLGWGKAANIGIKESKTQMVLLSQPDVEFVDNCIEKLSECIKNFKDFCILTPKDLNNELYTNYEIYNSYKKLEKNNKFNLEEVDFVDLTWLINKSHFDDNDLWDENIFLYFEAQDFAKRLKRKKKKIFVAKNITTYHIGSSSHDKKLEFYAKLNRNWHYNWSRYYFNKKHYGLLYANRKSIGIVAKLFLKYIRSLVFFQKNESKLIFAEIHGLISSVMNKKSFYRPYENINSNSNSKD